MAIKLIPHSVNNVIAFSIREKIEEEDMDIMLGLIEEKLKQEDKLRIYAEVDNWSGMSVAAFVEDLVVLNR